LQFGPNILSEGVDVLTEQEVSRSWQALFKGVEVTDEIVSKAGRLIDELRPESPLRHRLSTELSEIVKMKA